MFDTDHDAVYGDTVRTASGADLFSPGTCDGEARSTALGDCRPDRMGASYGVRLGFDRNISGSGIVLGGVVEVARSDFTEASSVFSTAPASYALSRSMRRSLGFRLRSGLVLGDRFLLYATGGASNARIKHDFRTTNTANRFTRVDYDDRIWGYQLGGGGEVMLGRNVALGAEYLYSDYDDDEFFVAAGPGTGPPTDPFLLPGNGANLRLGDTGLRLHTIRASLSYRF